VFELVLTALYTFLDRLTPALTLRCVVARRQVSELLLLRLTLRSLLIPWYVDRRIIYTRRQGLAKDVLLDVSGLSVLGADCSDLPIPTLQHLDGYHEPGCAT